MVNKDVVKIVTRETKRHNTLFSIALHNSSINLNMDSERFSERKTSGLLIDTVVIVNDALSFEILIGEIANP